MKRYTWIELTNMHLAYGAAFTSGRAAQRLYRDWYPNSSYNILQHSSQTMPIRDSTPTSRWPRTGRFVRTCWRTVLQYVENKIPLTLKRSVAAHRFPNKICFNESYLSGPKVCRSNLETLCIWTNIYIGVNKFFFIVQLAYWLHCYPELYFQKTKREEMPARVTYATLGLIYVLGAYLLK